MRIEGIQFYDFNSVNEGLRLTNRSAPTPDEKEIVEDIPYMQGVLDFSMLLGERVFNNRTLTYSFHTKSMSYRKRKSLEQRIKRLLSVQGEGNLYDTHDQGYYWLGKVVNSSVVDNPTFNRLEVEVTFNVYPFMIRNKSYFDDVWDDFNFESDVAGYTQFEVDGTRTITLYNAGDTTVRPNITVEVSEDG